MFDWLLDVADAFEVGYKVGQWIFGTDGRLKGTQGQLPSWAQQGTPAYGQWSYTNVPVGKVVVIDRETGGHKVWGANQGAWLAMSDLPALPTGSAVTIDPKTGKRGVLNKAAMDRAMKGCPTLPTCPVCPTCPDATAAAAPVQTISLASPMAYPKGYQQTGLAAVSKGILRVPPQDFEQATPLEGESCPGGFVEADGVCVPAPPPEPEQPSEPQSQMPASGCLPLCATPSGQIRAQGPRPPSAPRRPRTPRPINVNVRVTGCGCAMPRTARN